MRGINPVGCRAEERSEENKGRGRGNRREAITGIQETGVGAHTSMQVMRIVRTEKIWDITWRENQQDL